MLARRLLPWLFLTFGAVAMSRAQTAPELPDSTAAPAVPVGFAVFHVTGPISDANIDPALRSCRATKFEPSALGHGLKAAMGKATSIELEQFFTVPDLADGSSSFSTFLHENGKEHGRIEFSRAGVTLKAKVTRKWRDPRWQDVKARIGEDSCQCFTKRIGVDVQVVVIHAPASER